MSARILVVDDIPANVRLLEAKLSAEYFEVVTASDGPSALEAAAAKAPDLILLDVMMPGMDGFEVARKLKDNPKTRHIPVVMVTALSDTSDRVKGLDAGADDFLSKPVNDVALFARVRSLSRLKLMIDELRVRHASSGGEVNVDDDIVAHGAEMEPGKILLLESQDILAATITGYLEEAGHSVERAANGDEASAKLAATTPDLIIVNLRLGDEDGLRLCSHFRTKEETRHTPILLVISGDDLEQLAKGLDLGVTDYLVRPFDRNELLARTRTQIRRRRYHDQLRSMLDKSVSMAYTDPLTGIYNRRYMNANLDRQIMEIGDTQKPVSVIMFDLDYFKAVNDDHGHAAGDEILKTVAKRVSAGIRDFDMLARYGGEEFVVVMPNTPVELAASVAERLRKGLEEQPFGIANGAALKITASLGVATTSDPMETADSLLRRADEALYAAKRGGRNRVDIADEGRVIAEKEVAVTRG
jgi:two-component system cell cycle response regulator